MVRPLPAEQPSPAGRPLPAHGGGRRRARKDAARRGSPGRRGTGRGNQGRRAAVAWPAAHRLTLFFVLAFAISWLVWPLTLLNPNSSLLIPSGPAVAAAIAAFLAGGKAELLRLLQQLVRWRVAGRWYVAAVGLPCLVVAVSAGLTVSGGAPAPELWPNPGWFMLLGTFAFDPGDRGPLRGAGLARLRPSAPAAEPHRPVCSAAPRAGLGGLAPAGAAVRSPPGSARRFRSC